MYKKFSTDLFDKYNKLGRDIIKDKIKCLDNLDKYSYDLEVEHNYFKGIKVDVINVWGNSRLLPFKNINIRLFERKVDRYNNQILFIQLSSDLQTSCVFTKNMVSYQ